MRREIPLPRVANFKPRMFLRLRLGDNCLPTKRSPQKRRVRNRLWRKAWAHAFKEQAVRYRLGWQEVFIL